MGAAITQIYCVLPCLLQVLEGLETYITTEKFLHTLEAASAEWIDLCEHQHQHHKPGQVAPGGLELELLQVGIRTCAVDGSS